MILILILLAFSIAGAIGYWFWNIVKDWGGPGSDF